MATPSVGDAASNRRGGRCALCALDAFTVSVSPLWGGDWGAASPVPSRPLASAARLLPVQADGVAPAGWPRGRGSRTPPSPGLNLRCGTCSALPCTSGPTTNAWPGSLRKLPVADKAWVPAWPCRAEPAPSTARWTLTEEDSFCTKLQDLPVKRARIPVTCSTAAGRGQRGLLSVLPLQSPWVGVGGRQWCEPLRCPCPHV